MTDKVLRRGACVRRSARALCVMSTQDEASRIAGLIGNAQFSKALWVLRVALARTPRSPPLLELAAMLARTAQSKAMDLGYNKATDGSRKAQELESIAREAKAYLTP